MAYLKRIVTVHAPFYKFGIERLWWAIIIKGCILSRS